MPPPLPRCSGWTYSSLKLAHPYQPSAKPLSRRPAHRPFRGLLSVHSRCGLHTRAVTKIATVIRRLQTFRHLHACSGCFRLERSPGGTCTHWKAPPFHGAHPEQDIAPLKARIAASPELYGKTVITVFAGGDQEIAPPGSADFVLTFRNIHNWMRAGTADAAFRAFYKALKPGGILGLEEHRGRSDQPQDPQAKSGYVRQDYAIALAGKAGFKLIGSLQGHSN